ncbi:protein serine/threonine kinase, putative [Entamoeba invadens IP1]|uniref:Protein serine/threonine kinase, putative n=1 Tax=Entamoeba invadens IP1 TaxID=370355 RepID=A0A0A1U7P8_ENTIV|nr:protein serine/threonine kinase, putative [Entamoeba invadens IP1]ELP90867.1 protein serine/threonine kinase, putative [Entamoeba invadens IP1]|eukprot:XP_004257638.1 protein serine/threonine kinase, putative [Entamoeba invadens IP1]
MLISNMTFTKGVGTPKYMAPEILNRKHYTDLADVYSFGITFLEIMKWEDAFPKEKFKMAWDIADFVAAGSVLPKPINVSDIDYKVFLSLTCKYENRCQMKEVVQKLEQL